MGKNRAWLEKIERGDKVVKVNERALGGKARLLRVIRVTKTQIVLQGDLRYYKEDGRAVGRGPYSCDRIEEATPESLTLVLKERLGAQLYNMGRQSLDHLNGAKLKRVEQILEELERALEL